MRQQRPDEWKFTKEKEAEKKAADKKAADKTGADKTAEKAAEKNAEEASAKAAEKPADKSTAKAAEKPAEPAAAAVDEKAARKARAAELKRINEQQRADAKRAAEEKKQADEAAKKAAEAEKKAADAEKKEAGEAARKAAEAEKKAAEAEKRAAARQQKPAASPRPADQPQSADRTRPADRPRPAEQTRPAEAPKTVAQQTRKTPETQKVDEVRPPAVINPEARPDAWKMQQEKDREKKPDARAVQPGEARPAGWTMEREKAREEQRAAQSSGASGAGRSGTAGSQTQAAAGPKPKTPWRGWSNRAIVSLNGGWQSSSFETRDTRDFASPIAGDPERRTMTADYAVNSGVAYDFGGIVRVWKGLGAGIAVTRFEDSRDVTVNGTVPHPFFFNRPRAVSGAIEGTRQETAVHVNAAWVVPVNRKLQIALFGGPSFYSVKQTVVTDFSFSESYPYDEATLTRLVTEEESSSVTGFNVGADVGYYFTDTIGVGAIIRFGRGSIDSSLGSLDVGGPEFGAGVRIRIR